jgi:H+/Cl- antiporter ClcA
MTSLLWRYAVWLACAAGLASVALWFSACETWSGEFIRRLHDQSPWTLFIWMPAGLLAIVLLRDNVFRGTDGTGIPQTIASLRMAGAEESRRESVLSWRVGIGKVLLTTIGLFTGASMGREGPSVHVGACCMHLAARMARFPEHLVRRGLILGGGAAGIAASFNAPLAGIVFAFEEMGRSYERENAVTVAATAAIACVMVVIAVQSQYVFYGAVVTQLADPSAWLAVPALGISLGLLGGSFSACLLWLMPRVTSVAKNGWRGALVVTVAIGVCLAGLGLVSGGASLGSGYDEASKILQGHELSPYYGFTRMAASFLTLLTAIPGGLFDPSLSAGAGFGLLLAPCFPEAAPASIVMLAMVAYFTGVVQSPLTSTIIMIEMTSCPSMGLPMLMTAIIAASASRAVCRTPLYEALSEQFLKHNPVR